MEIHLPDPYPGRCLNFRHDTSRTGQSLRCLEAEGTRHVCRFETPQPVEHQVLQGGIVYTSKKPERWKVPPA